MTSILWLHSDRGGCGAYRAYLPALSLAAAGFDSHFLHHQKMLLSNPDTELEGIDLVVFQRAVGPVPTRWMDICAARGIATVMEVDDDLFNVPRKNPAAWLWNKKQAQQWLRDQFNRADHIIVSTAPLKTRVLQEMRWTTGAKITICPNHLHPEVWRDAVAGPRVENHGRTVIGWQGSLTHNTDFQVAAVALGRVVKDCPEAVLRLFGAVPSALQGHVPVERFQYVKGVPYDQYPATLAYLNYDIGIAPITDSLFNRAKSNVKLLEYAALSIPAVASRVYPYTNTVREGETGFLATTPDEWYAALIALVRDPALRARVGAAAHADVWSRFGPTCANAWGTVFRSLVPIPVEVAS
jgi:glycosyltransferase involved in cell wall biosynthesis